MVTNNNGEITKRRPEEQNGSCCCIAAIFVGVAVLFWQRVGLSLFLAFCRP